MSRLPRPHIPMSVKLDAAILQLGLDPATAQLDHYPALTRRARTPDGGYKPAANDPRYMRWLDPDAHLQKTSGGPAKATYAGTDKHFADKMRRMDKAAAFHRTIMAAKDEAEPPPRQKGKRPWPKRTMRRKQEATP